MLRTLEDPFYYLANFRRALDWVSGRYCHLLNDEEHAFAAQFGALPQAAQALLVRMVMRKGDLFRASKLRYAEIGCTRDAARTLAGIGWVDAQPLLTLEQLFALTTKPELVAAFKLNGARAALPKAELLDMLRAEHADARPFDAWHGGDDCVYQLLVDPLCERLRLLFFGNGYQDWSEFVLADLGVYRYETVEMSAHSLGFRTRADVDTYLHLHRCRERFEQGETPHTIHKDLPAQVLDNEWLESRRAKLLFALAQQHERDGELETALDIYRACAYPGSRVRRVRVLERLARFEAAHDLAVSASQVPESEGERQQLMRTLPRLQRRLGLPKSKAPAAAEIERIDLALPPPADQVSVEQAATTHLATSDGPVYYVENTLIGSLFGLLCWQAIFAPVPGAFFHPFHTGPADLNSPDFLRRREALFARCMAELDSDAYKETINRHYAEKFGIQSPFVAWSVLGAELKDLALDCIPATHLKTFFERILLDIRNHCSGLPDLVQFHPAERRYRLIEVKGPGDRLQDNQIRWFDYFSRHGIPVAVCYVQWQAQP